MLRAARPPAGDQRDRLLDERGALAVSRDDGELERLVSGMLVVSWL